MKINEIAFQKTPAHEFGTLLFDLKNDPEQKNPLNNPVKEAEMIELMKKIMKENDAPEEQYQRLGI